MSLPQAIPRKPEPDEVRAARKGVTDAANVLAKVWSDPKHRAGAQATLAKAQNALTGALTRNKLPT